MSQPLNDYKNTPPTHCVDGHTPRARWFLSRVAKSLMQALTLMGQHRWGMWAPDNPITPAEARRPQGLTR